MELDIKELVAMAHFNYVGPAFPSWWGKNKTKFVLPSLRGIARELMLGGAYFQTLKVAYKGEQFVFPNEPLISMSLAKTIVETATVGKERRGTVKEYICTEDYALTRKGVCINEDPERRDEYPSEQVQELHRMFEIRRIVLQDIQWEEMAGEQGLQKYTITAVSDSDFYADLTDKARALKTL